jgi:fumarate reductase flavoprotein subunit
MPVVRGRLPAFSTSVPVIVIGAGAAGAVAALAARDAGAKVIVLDRDAPPTGATALSSGMIPAAGTAAQSAREIEDTPERFADDIRRSPTVGLHVIWSRRIRARLRAATLDWLGKAGGLRFELVEGVPPGTRLRRACMRWPSAAVPLLSALYRALAADGVQVQPGARVTDLYLDDENRVRGVGTGAAVASRWTWAAPRW